MDKESRWEGVPDERRLEYQKHLQKKLFSITSGALLAEAFWIFLLFLRFAYHWAIPNWILICTGIMWIGGGAYLVYDTEKEIKEVVGIKTWR